MNEHFPFVTLFVLLLLLNACASNPGQGIAPVPVEDRSLVNRDLKAGQNAAVSSAEGMVDGNVTLPKRKEARKNTNNQPMIVALLHEVDEKMDGGDNSGAAATVERALRLDPKNAMLWHRLGLLRLRQKSWQQAINLAKKSNSLAAGDYVLQAANWRLIAQANSRAGDKTAAKIAAGRAESLEKYNK